MFFDSTPSEMASGQEWESPGGAAASAPEGGTSVYASFTVFVLVFCFRDCSQPEPEAEYQCRS